MEETHLVPCPSGLSPSKKQRSYMEDADVVDPKDVCRIPYQAPLVVGSWCGKNDTEIGYGPSSDMHIWNDCYNTWTKNPNGLQLPTKICYNGRAFVEPYLYIFGGYDGERMNSTGMPNAYKVNIETLEWTEIAPLKVKRLYITGSALGDGSVLALGGSSSKKASMIINYMDETGDRSFINETGRMSIVEEYIISENRWRRLPNMIDCRSDASACSHKDIVYVAGGFNGKECLNSVEMYIQDFHQWTKLPNMNEMRSGLSLVIYQGNLLAICGFGGKKEEGTGKKGRHRTVECLKLDHETLRYKHQKKGGEVWRELPAKLNEGRSNFGACVLNDNQIVVCGGFNTGTLRSCERWHGSLEEVSSLAYAKFEVMESRRHFKKTGWHQVQELPIEMSAMSVVTIQSRDKPLTSVLVPRQEE